MAVDHAAIVQALSRGEAQKAIARRLGCSPGTVNRLAKLNGLEPGSAKNQAAMIEVENLIADYTLERRVALLNKMFAKAEELVDTATTPHKLQALAIATGILTDKRRLEDGEATARTEVNGGDARERIARRLDELAERRAAKGAA